MASGLPHLRKPRGRPEVSQRPFWKTTAMTLAAVLWFLLWAWPLFTPPASSHHAKRPCGQHWWKSTFQRRQLIRCEDARIGAPGSSAYILRIAECESGPDLMDTYAGDGHGGPFQQATRYWPTRRAYVWNGGYRKAWDRWEGQKPVTNFRANVIISLRMAKARGWEGDWACA